MLKMYFHDVHSMDEFANKMFFRKDFINSGHKRLHSRSSDWEYVINMFLKYN
jgi:predicted DNA-binding protein YlxM (UPF0122 family)